MLTTRPMGMSVTKVNELIHFPDILPPFEPLCEVLRISYKAHTKLKNVFLVFLYSYYPTSV